MFYSGEAEPRPREVTGSTGVDQWGSQAGTGVAELETGLTVGAQARIKAQAAMEPPAPSARAVWGVSHGGRQCS